MPNKYDKALKGMKMNEEQLSSVVKELKELSRRRSENKLYSKGFNERTKRLLYKTFGKSKEVRIKDLK